MARNDNALRWNGNERRILSLMPAIGVNGPKQISLAVSASIRRLPLHKIFSGLPGALRGVRAAGLSYLILAKHSLRRSSSERTCVSMVFCNASVPLLDNSAEAFLSKFCFQSRIACLVAVCSSDVGLRYAFMQASAVEHV